MSDRVENARTLRVDALSRVEGEGGLLVKLRGAVVEGVELRIYEPPRLFESLLKGRPLEEVPDITARICGICPVAYQMSSVHALEAALGVAISPEIRRLRRLMYCGEWIESHVLHMYLLQAPDFLGYDSGLEMARDHGTALKRGLRLKKIGNRLLEVLGGRAIHPINTAVGGFYRAPRGEELAALIPDFTWGLEAAVETAHWVSTFRFPEFEIPYESVALSHAEEYAMNEGRVRSSAGVDIDVTDYPKSFEERQVPHSTALHSVRIPSGKSYLVGPLARFNLNFEQLSPTARRTADKIGFTPPCTNPFKNILARALEVIQVYEEALDILRSYRPPSPPRIPYEHRAGEGHAATEAPRGTLYHRYRVTNEGKIEEAVIVPPTSQNQMQIENDLRDYLPRLLAEKEYHGGDNDARLGRLCENLVRSYDPCISCSTHFLKVTWERGETIGENCKSDQKQFPLPLGEGGDVLVDG